MILRRDLGKKIYTAGSHKNGHNDANAVTTDIGLVWSRFSFTYEFMSLSVRLFSLNTRKPAVVFASEGFLSK